MKNHLIKPCALSLFILVLSACAALKDKTPREEVPIAITIQANDYQLSSVNLDVYAYKVADRLDDFSSINLSLVDPDTAAIDLKINIERFNAFPPEERISRRTLRRNVQVGTDQSGRPIYQTVVATVDVVQSRIRTSALFNVAMRFKNAPESTFKRSFSENLNIDNAYVANIQGDRRAVDPSLYSATMPPMPPLTDDILLALSNREMLERLSREIRNRYP
jgi:hypothetical protein